MIAEDEYERRVSHWFDLVMHALEANIRRVLETGRDFAPGDMDNAEFALAMKLADQYQRQFLPEEVLAYYLDPTMPEGYFDEVSRADFLLHQGLLQRNAERLASLAIAKARE